MKPVSLQKVRATITIAAAFCFLSFQSSAQVSSSPPQQWTTATSIDFGFGSSRLELSHNSPEIIRQELLDTNTIHLIARWSALSDAELATVQIVPNAGGKSLQLYQIGRAEKAFTVLGERLRAYVRAREEGHTKSFLFTAISNKVLPLSIADTDLRVLVLNRPLIPVSWVTRTDSGTRTNKAGQVAGVSTTTTFINGQIQTISVTNKPNSDEICRWVSYAITDGEVAWQYILNFSANGRLDYIYENRHDAKEDDPKFQKTIKAVDDEVETEMKKKGTFGQFGSVHELWHLKKEKLKAKGIDWRSPADLNPNTSFD